VLLGIAMSSLISLCSMRKKTQLAGFVGSRIFSGSKVALASFHLEGEVQLWFQILLRKGRERG
jgi:hypothetical protein